MRVINDLSPWIVNKASADAHVHIITIVLHRSCRDYAKDKINGVAKNAKKNIDFRFWRAITLEDRGVYPVRRDYINSSDVLRPTAIPDDNTVQAYVDNIRHDNQLFA